MIFVGNNAQGDVAGDDATNSTALKAAYSAAGAPVPNALAGDSGGTPLPMPGFACTQVTVPGPIITPEIPAWSETVVVPGTSFPAQTQQNPGCIRRVLQNDAGGRLYYCGESPRGWPM